MYDKELKKNNFHILIIDDDEKIRLLLKQFLENNEFKVSDVENTDQAKKIMKSLIFDLLVIDIMMPGQNGLDFLKEIRQTNSIPTLMLTAMSSPEDRLDGLEYGADDYLAKPFEPKELILRINNILNKIKIKFTKRLIEFGDVKIDLNKLLIKKNNIEFKINNTEKSILEQMINSPGKIFSRQNISSIINIDKERSIDVIITRLRKKIESNPKKSKYLQTVRGEGYVLWIE